MGERLFRLFVSTSTCLSFIAMGAVAHAAPATYTVGEATIAETEAAMKAGAISSVELTALYLNRIAAYYRAGIKLNAIPVLNPRVLEHAAAADRSRAEGKSLPLLGIPFTVKDSYKVKGMTVAAGSPAFAQMIANENAFTVQQLLDAGGVLVGRTNMPPLAEGGMQRGVYGRAESPYNAGFLTAAYASGSSNGSATSVASNMAMFGMGEETVSSGRSPASNNALVAYTPSRGLVSIRGNWPLYPVRDVVVPHTRTVADMFALLNVLMVRDPITRGDFWRDQTAVPLPDPMSVRPARFESLARPDALKGKRIAVPTMFIGKDPTLGRPIVVRPSILALWEKAASDLRALGAEVVEVDFPVMHNVEEDRPSYQSVVKRGLFPEAWWGLKDGKRSGPTLEFTTLNAYAWEQFVRDNGDPNLPSWLSVQNKDIFPFPANSVDFKRRGPFRDYSSAIAIIRQGIKRPSDLPGFAEALRGYEAIRKVDFEKWMAENGFDYVVFPANADVGPADADVVEASYDLAQRNGVYFSNMNSVMRELGIPSVSAPMGKMADIGMPVNLTFIGPAYSDPELLEAAYAYEQKTRNRWSPPRTPALSGETIHYDTRITPPAARSDKSPPKIGPHKLSRLSDGAIRVEGGASDNVQLGTVRVFLQGRQVYEGASKTWKINVPAAKLNTLGVNLNDGVYVTVLAKDIAGNASAIFEHKTP